MRSGLRTKLGVATLAVLLSAGSFALFAPSGPAIAFSSGGLFLDVQVESTANLVARGAAVDVTLEVTCSGTRTAEVYVNVTQKAGSGVAQGCTGSGELITVRVPASGGKAFKQGVAVVSAEISACGTRVCGSETDSETVELRR